MIYFIIICAVLGAISLVTFILYGADKRRAVKGKWRVPEKVLLSLSFFGGAIGGVLGMSIFRHKPKKAAFIFVNTCGFLWQAAAIILAAIYLI